MVARDLKTRGYPGSKGSAADRHPKDAKDAKARKGCEDTWISHLHMKENVEDFSLRGRAGFIDTENS